MATSDPLLENSTTGTAISVMVRLALGDKSIIPVCRMVAAYTSPPKSRCTGVMVTLSIGLLIDAFEPIAEMSDMDPHEAV